MESDDDPKYGLIDSMIDRLSQTITRYRMTKDMCILFDIFSVLWSTLCKTKMSFASREVEKCDETTKSETLLNWQPADVLTV